MSVKIYEEAIGGLCAGILGTVIGYPLDLVKTRMQTSAGTERNMLQVGIHVFRQEGFLSLYKGMGPPLLSLSILNTINFSSYSYFRDVYGAKKGLDIRNALAGATAGPLASSISTVEHLVKTQMQMDNVNLKQYQGSWHCVKSLVKSNGLSILYTGHMVNTAREGLFLASYFFSYEALRECFIQTFHVSTEIAVPISGGISGAFAWFVSFPLDCVKAGIQSQAFEKDIKPKAKDVAKSLWRTKGIRGLYSGVTPTLIRAFLVSGSRFSAYEFALWAMKQTH